MEPEKKPNLGGQILVAIAAIVGGAIGSALIKGLSPNTIAMLFGGGVAGALCGLLSLFHRQKEKQTISHYFYLGVCRSRNDSRNHLGSSRSGGFRRCHCANEAVIY